MEEFNFCFICLKPLDRQTAEVKAGRKTKEELLNRKRTSSLVKCLLNYLLHGRSDSVLNEVLEFSGALQGTNDLDGTGNNNRNSHKKKGPKLFQICGKCEAVATTLLGLHLELEKLKMLISNEISTVKETVLRGSGWLGGGGSGSDDGGGQEELFQQFSAKFLGGGCSSKMKNLFKILKSFQTAVLETNKNSLHAPNVYLEGSSDNTRPSLDENVKVEPSHLENYDDDRDEAEEPFFDASLFLSQDDCTNEARNNSILNFDQKILPDPPTKKKSETISVPRTKSAGVNRVPRRNQLADGKLKKVKRKSSLLKVPKAKKASSSPPKVNHPKSSCSRIRSPNSANLHYQCSSCDFRAGKLGRFEQHLREHEKEGNKAFTCEKCNVGFSTLQHHTFHQEQHQGLHKLMCDICQDYFDRFELPTHMKSHVETIFPCSYCSHCTSSAEKYMDHIRRRHRIKDGGDLKCGICEGLFPTKKTLMDHLHEVHNAVKEFKCDFEGCNKTFLYAQTLNLHKNGHTGRFLCNECGKVYISQQSLEVHQQYVHQGEKPFKCDQCPETCISRNSLQEHVIREHGGDKFECKICGKEYNSTSGLNSHMRLKHDDINAKSCPICQKKCSNAFNLRIHMDQHNITKNYVCHECGKSFQTVTGLNVHKQTHMERKHQCSYCPKAFTQKRYLVEHLRTHTGERPFVCDFCGKAFSQKAPRNAHRKQCTSNRFSSVTEDTSNSCPLSNSFGLDNSTNSCTS